MWFLTTTNISNKINFSWSIWFTGDYKRAQYNGKYDEFFYIAVDVNRASDNGLIDANTEMSNDLRWAARYFYICQNQKKFNHESWTGTIGLLGLLKCTNKLHQCDYMCNQSADSHRKREKDIEREREKEGKSRWLSRCYQNWINCIQFTSIKERFLVSHSWVHRY